ncbi:MAG: hypothetical protein H7Y03_02450 [Chitinophagaceae bacterium]|nr:hypothetical protein [Chitinophagaceae bacterium]
MKYVRQKLSVQRRPVPNRQKLGSKFKLADFHEELLKDGLHAIGGAGKEVGCLGGGIAIGLVSSGAL